MRIALVADVFPPVRSSGAVQLRDLAIELAKLGHTVTVLVPDADIDTPWRLETINSVSVLRLRAYKTRDMSYVRRTLSELAMPFVMRHNFKKSPLADTVFDGVVWYSPSIFFGPFVNWLKKKNGCASYLILRDIFPEWAADMGLMNRGPVFRFFKHIASFQYTVADVIGIQTPGNIEYFQDNADLKPKIEVLHNWLAPMKPGACSIDISCSPLNGRRIFVYAGNMGVAQGMGVLLDLAQSVVADTSIGFVFVGRGSDVEQLKAESKARGLDNVLFFDEIEPEEIAGLYAQTNVGLVSLDPRHRTHNIPGKFISYMHCGLPVLAFINAENDLESIITEQQVGVASSEYQNADLRALVSEAIEISELPETSVRCKKLAETMFSSDAAAQQVVTALKSKSGTQS